MMKKLKIAGIVFAAIIVFSAIAALFCLQRLPVWYVNYHHRDGNLRIAGNMEEVACDISLTRDEVITLLKTDQIETMEDAYMQFRFAKVRKTFQGYYAILKTVDGYKIYIFFRYFVVNHYVTCTSFVNSEDGMDDIQMLTYLYEKGGYEYCPIPHESLNTGAAYEVFFFKDTMVIARFNRVEEMGDPSIERTGEAHFQLVGKVYYLPYARLRWNPIYQTHSFYNSIDYIKKIDRK